MIVIAEHENMMHEGFKEVYNIKEAIRKAREMTDAKKTLIIATADHGHALTLPRYLDSDERIFQHDSSYVSDSYNLCEWLNNTASAAHTSSD
ncbi:hypothetical protein KIN20_015139 [Parelaphostrongylus tenuis]|uniref:alkaline phosphatase n=1 Tax=Parelaphostrongylus tenuis TaxID=148309 RepID=A0AAD5N0B3_PARTN|nr:hypothetical protein KIN20_015139 [Parelaphostrongylus tenuis]